MRGHTYSNRFNGDCITISIRTKAKIANTPPSLCAEESKKFLDCAFSRLSCFIALGLIYTNYLGNGMQGSYLAMALNSNIINSFASLWLNNFSFIWFQATVELHINIKQKKNQLETSLILMLGAVFFVNTSWISTCRKGFKKNSTPLAT